MSKRGPPNLNGLSRFRACLLASLVLMPSCRNQPQPSTIQNMPARESTLAEAKIPSASAQRCAQCHREPFDQWLDSQHAWANRPIDLKKDGIAFSKGGKFQVGSSRAGATAVEGKFRLFWMSPDGKKTDYLPDAVIGVGPLWQYLVPFPGGRWQVFPLAWDPAKEEWFHIFGEEDRQAHEWGHWANRGNNWNSRCASCHMTGFQKGYDPLTDNYHSSWKESGISCAQCHGEMKGHPGNQWTGSPNAKPTPLQNQENCASCHARREELTGKFYPGAPFHDHYRLTLADARGVYYPDGQVREEDFEYGSFLMSRMGNKGVTCLDCHHPHSGKLILPATDNSLCLSCHLPPGQRGALPIEPLAHSHHPAGSRGNLCIDCHMPVTNFMVRDPRRDHGFTIPDPLLTKELGIPNACNRCHTDRSADWALKWTQNWYGAKMERRGRARARAIDRAQRGDASVVPELLALAQGEEIPAWRASLISLLAPWVGRAEVLEFITSNLKSENPLIRSAAVRALGQIPEASAQVQPLQTDPSRLVRLDALWAGVVQGKGASADLRELVEYIRVNGDQPEGALRQAQFSLVMGKNEEAEASVRKAADWDFGSAYAQFMKGRILDLLGKKDEALADFQRAQKLEPENPDYLYALALSMAELKRPAEALGFLEKTVRVDPSFGRAWYNLGLAYAQADRLDPALSALIKAEVLLPDSPDPAYAQATLYLRKQDLSRAREAAERALNRNPQFQPAREILQKIGN